jgi:regulator of protease activity HflC (stomatin/prohibitin superfamily)
MSSAIPWQYRSSLIVTQRGLEYAPPNCLQQMRDTVVSDADLYTSFRSAGIESIISGFIKDKVRDTITTVGSQYRAEDINGQKRPEFTERVERELSGILDKSGITLNDFAFVGEFGIPDTLKEAINAKITATQKAQQRENELRETTAQVQKDVERSRGLALSKSIEAEGQAKANRTLAQSITPELVEWQRLQVQKDAVEKWNGESPQVIGGQGMIFNLPLQPKQ